MSATKHFADSIINVVMERINTSIPAIIQRVYTEDEATVVDVQLAINEVNRNGIAEQAAVLEGIPFASFGNADFNISVKPNVNDSVLVIFCMSDITRFKNSAGDRPVNPATPRKHSISDAIAIPLRFNLVRGVIADDEAAVIRNKETEIRLKTDGSIDLGKDAVERVLLGDAFMSKFLSHTHTYSNQGVPTLTTGVTTTLSVPDQSGMWEDTISQKVKTT